MPNWWEPYNRDILIQSFGGNEAAARASVQFWSPSQTIDGGPINYNATGPQWSTLPGVYGLIPPQYMDYARTYPGRWSNVYRLGESVLGAIPSHASMRNNPATVNQFVDKFLRNGIGELPTLWATGSQGPGVNAPWEYDAPVPRALRSILGFDISNDLSNSAGIRSGPIRALGDNEWATLFSQGRQSPINDYILGIRQASPQQQLQQQPTIDMNQFAQALAPALAKRRDNMQPGRQAGWWNTGYNQGGAAPMVGVPY